MFVCLRESAAGREDVGMKREQMETLGWTGAKLNGSQSAVRIKRRQETCRQTDLNQDGGGKAWLFWDLIG